MNDGSAVAFGSASDATYHARHASRSRRRAKCIASHISESATVLDIGCNFGITSKHLLDSGKATHVTGVELSADTVSPALKSDQRFELIEGNVVSLELTRRFDICIYGAVHHHVLNHFGMGTAVAVLQKLAACCDRTLFFETGQLSEGGQWSWQREMLRHFRTDEEHVFYILACIEPLIQDFQVIGRFWIHGIRRWYLKIDLVEPSSRIPLPLPGPQIPIAKSPKELYGRSCGSDGQKLIPLESDEVRHSPTLFGIAEGLDGGKLFLKRYVHFPTAGMREFRIGEQCSEEWAVRCMGFAGDASTLVFPFIENANSIGQAPQLSEGDRRTIAKDVLRIFRTASKVPIEIKSNLLLPARGEATLLDLCDFNQNNWLIVDAGGSLRIRVIDFEQQSRHYRWRNRIHLGRILLKLRFHRGRAILEITLGLAEGLCLLSQYQVLSVERRIRDRQPSLLSFVVTVVRTYAGKVLGRILNIARSQ